MKMKKECQASYAISMTPKATNTTGPISTTYYYYNDLGNVERILTKDESPDPGVSQFTTTRLHYETNGVAVTFILGERWDWDGVDGSCPTDYVVDYAREYYFGGPRERYAVRELDLPTLMNGGVFANSEVFSEFDGDQVYNDFTIGFGGVVTVLRSYETGVGHVNDPSDLPNRVTNYYHPDKIGTTRMMSLASGAATDASVYTAFGELVEGTNHRYGYVGKEGYQAHDEFSLLHVGARYYDPGIGRFVQRDPIGIRGGLNLYEYVRSSPTVAVDPDGLFADYHWDKPKPRPKPTPGPHPYRPTILEAAAGLFLDLTPKWLDDKEQVDKASKAFATLGAVCTVFVPWPKVVKAGLITGRYFLF